MSEQAKKFLDDVYQLVNADIEEMEWQLGNY